MEAVGQQPCLGGWNQQQFIGHMRHDEVCAASTFPGSRHKETLACHGTPQASCRYHRHEFGSVGKFCRTILVVVLCLALQARDSLGQGTSKVETICSGDTSACTQRLIIDLEVDNKDV